MESDLVTVAVFTANNCRLIKGTAESWKNNPNAVVNPDLSEVKGLPPHFWVLSKDGRILPMQTEDRSARMVHINQHGADNVVVPLSVVQAARDKKARALLSKNNLDRISLFLSGLIAGAVVTLLLFGKP